MINQEQKDQLNEYARIKSEIKLLESKADELNPLVLQVIQDAEVEEIEISDLGKLSLASRRTWKYSLETQELEKKLKSEKKLEEQTGKAEFLEKKYVIFKGLKEDENN